MHLGRGSPQRESEKLLRAVRRALGTAPTGEVPVDQLGSALAHKRLVITRARPPHRLVPEHHLAQVLAALGLPLRRAK
jgi:hypothetical protein